MRADLIWPGVQSGWAALTSAAAPVECGADMEVPAMIWYSCPGGPDATSVGTGVLPPRIWRPGAVMSGLMKSVPGPRDENVVMTSPRTWVLTPVCHRAVTPVCEVRNVSIAVAGAGPSSMTVGTQKSSVNRSW